jgi:hypothetical protein
MWQFRASQNGGFYLNISSSTGNWVVRYICGQLFLILVMAGGWATSAPD